MELDFNDQFSDYTNVELLKIVNRPEEYQSAAIDAASEILKKRLVSEKDVHATENYFIHIEEKERIKKEKAEAITNNLTDFLEPILKPGPTIEPKKWLNLFLVAVALEYCWSVFFKIKYLIEYVKYLTRAHDGVADRGVDANLFYFEILSDLAIIIYIPFLFYLLYKKRRWGWILLYANQLMFLVFSVFQSYFYFKYRSIHHDYSGSSLFWIFLRGAFVYFLWQHRMASHFNITKETKTKTTAVAIILALIYLSLLKIYFY
jgi:hypothetical protein